MNSIQKGLIDDTFSFDYSQEKGFGFAMIGGDTNEPDTISGYSEKNVSIGKTR